MQWDWYEDIINNGDVLNIKDQTWSYFFWDDFYGNASYWYCTFVLPAIAYHYGKLFKRENVILES